MLLNFSLALKVAICLFLVVQLASQNHYWEAVAVTRVITITTAILLCLRVFWKNQRKIGLRTSFLALIPLSIYVSFSFVLNNLGGYGAE